MYRERETQREISKNVANLVMDVEFMSNLNMN